MGKLLATILGLALVGAGGYLLIYWENAPLPKVARAFTVEAPRCLVCNRAPDEGMRLDLARNTLRETPEQGRQRDMHAPLLPVDVAFCGYHRPGPEQDGITTMLFLPVVDKYFLIIVSLLAVLAGVGSSIASLFAFDGAEWGGVGGAIFFYLMGAGAHYGHTMLVLT